MDNVVVRSSKAFADARWNNRDYRLTVTSPDDVLTALDRLDVETILVDESVRPSLRMPHHKLLERTIAEHPDRFPLLFRTDVERLGTVFPGGLSVYSYRRAF
jgi:hypothetical protein